MLHTTNRKTPNRPIRRSRFVTCQGIFSGVFLAGLFLLSAQGSLAIASECEGLSLQSGEVIWCDSFEDTDLPPSGNIADNYFDYDAEGGRQGRSNTIAKDGEYSLRQTWAVGDISTGHLFRGFGRSPVASQSHSGTDFREIYWRIFVRYPQGTTQFPDKLTRATVFATPNWAQAMIAHVWLSSSDRRFLLLDPASGVDTNGVLQTTAWNDFANLRWFGSRTATQPVIAGEWQCVEANVKLDDSGAANGQFKLWIDGELVASQQGLEWLGAYDDYGLNAIMVSGYWNGGAPVALERYLDAFVIATGRVGCTAATPRPQPPGNLSAQ